MTIYLEDSHPEVYDPPELTATIWRYMSLAKFVSLVLPLNDDRSVGGLRLSRVDTLGDPREGVPGEPSAEAAAEVAVTQSAYYVSSWHLNEVESAALWRLYGGGEGTVAVQSTYGRLRTAILCDRSVGIGRVRYASAEQREPQASRVSQLLRKRLNFEYERELRIVACDAREIPGPTGLVLPIKLDLLIESIYIAPFDEQWVGDTVRRLLRTLEHDYTVLESAI